MATEAAQDGDHCARTDLAQAQNLAVYAHYALLVGQIWQIGSPARGLELDLMVDIDPVASLA